MRETWHPISRTITGTFDLVRYWYTNGRPSRMELADVGTDGQTLNGYTTYYIKFNWHGDATAFVDGSNGNGGDGWYAYDPWGNAAPPPWPLPNWKTWDHYHWNGGWGYLFFQDLGMYYVHGRWYRPDLGLFISPDAKGEYLYGSGQDAVNQAWAFLQDLSNQSGEIEEDISDLADEARDYSLGAGYQFVNDQTFQLPNIIFGTEWQRRQTYTFYWGQQGGRTASDWVGKALLVKGGYDIAVGLTVIPPTAATGALCTAGTSGVCAIPTGAGLAIETSMVLVGVTESAYAGGVLYFANQNPVSYSGSGELSVNSKGEPYPDVNVPGYGKVPIPSGPFEKVGQFQRDSLRNEFRNKTRNAFVKWWIEQGLPLPSGRFEVHHIQPLEWGGTNDFSNLVILPYEVHRRIFNPWWQFFRP